MKERQPSIIKNLNYCPIKHLIIILQRHGPHMFILAMRDNLYLIQVF